MNLASTSGASRARASSTKSNLLTNAAGGGKPGRTGTTTRPPPRVRPPPGSPDQSEVAAGGSPLHAKQQHLGASARLKLEQQQPQAQPRPPASAQSSSAPSSKELASQLRACYSWPQLHSTLQLGQGGAGQLSSLNAVVITALASTLARLGPGPSHSLLPPPPVP